MLTKNITKKSKIDEFQQISEKLFNFFEPHTVFGILKQCWNETDPSALYDHLAEAMNFYENFYCWLLQNKNLQSQTVKKAKKLLHKIHKQKALLLKLSTCAS